MPVDMDYEKNPTVLCAENIALLFLLHSVPCVPKATPINVAQIREAGYVLPFEKERGLASTLAFLSSLRDDPNRIPALCIESVPDADALKIHIAVNKSSFDDGQADLLEMTGALSKILASLSRVADASGNSNTAENVFDMIMAVCSERILGRLHLRANHKQKIKKPIGETLRLATASLRQLREKILDRAGLMDAASIFEARADEAVKLVNAWNKHQTTIRLRDLVEGIHKMWMIDRLHELLDCIPNSLMDPNLRTSLRHIIGKVARYKEAARYLYRMAKRFPSLRRAEVISVTLQRQMFAKLEIGHYSPSLSTTLRRIASQHNLPHNPDRIYSLLKLSKERAEQFFSEHVQRALKGAKIHAEVQLFYHVEALQSVQPPRVVCSSKDACYLCDYFMTTLTKIHSPKCHGRLYPSWRLPALSAHDRTPEKLNHALEKEAGNSIRNLVKKKRKFSLPDPRESTVLTIRRSASTLVSSSLNLNTAAVLTDTVNVSRASSPRDDVRQRTPQLSNERFQVVQDIIEHPVLDQNKTSATNISAVGTTGDQSQTILPPGRQSIIHYKREAHHDQLIVGFISQDAMSCIHVGPFKLYVEYSATPDESKERHNKDLKLDVEWVTTVNNEPALHDVESSIIDIENSAHVASLPLDSLNQLDVNYQGQILRIRLYPA
ncbi:hypothetical protein NW762_012866 [Fusarium torreyae]|uniref:Uncharacterized protein n=1 Tax=Fusarium torreyae TaxID=1237075 RepID=A0A9W8V8A9_9HYPO|nr:hypothetical protein NW762_012866 [Fusarium torreyae]